MNLELLPKGISCGPRSQLWHRCSTDTNWSFVFFKKTRVTLWNQLPQHTSLWADEVRFRRVNSLKLWCHWSVSSSCLSLTFICQDQSQSLSFLFCPHYSQFAHAKSFIQLWSVSDTIVGEQDGETRWWLLPFVTMAMWVPAAGDLTLGTMAVWVPAAGYLRECPNMHIPLQFLFK